MLFTRQHEGDGFVVCVDQQQKRFIPNRFTCEGQNLDRVAAEQHPEATHEWRFPLFLAHFVATGIKPHHIFDLTSANAPALEKFWPAKDGMIFLVNWSSRFCSSLGCQWSQLISLSWQ